MKICGIQNTESLQAAVEAGADFIGFMFADSKRRISTEKAKLLAAYVPTQVQKVGVFVNPTLKEVLDGIQQVGLNFVQLHGEESPDFCREIPVPVIKAFSIKNSGDIQKASQYDVAYYLFDSPGGKYRGGSGMTFDWSLLKDVNIPREQVILAGGLKPDNIQAAISEVNPAMVDVSSGVEIDGMKDLEKIQIFIQRAKKER
ncbi:phosphoribosylanthranilate isomerase [Salinibacillus xinjiangensis]|uniref:phosphoribosylanthranilate isomerase n=1 Tax=Salinibacillus xinjiangensis TaxID=1229268 RepID=UPI002B277826|nr:phosphoribosylanthranilate isomerase [Salinibacillus xinjiangensis]